MSEQNNNRNSTKKPCLIRRGTFRGKTAWVAWNEDGALIAHSEDYELLSLTLLTREYEQVPWNSRAAAGIKDKLAEKARQKGWI